MERQHGLSKQARIEKNSRQIQSIGSLVSQLISRRGYAQSVANDHFTQAIASVVGNDLVAEVTVGKLNRGVLKIFAGDSVTIQELTFQKRQILAALNQRVPDANVNDLRFAVQKS